MESLFPAPVFQVSEFVEAVNRHLTLLGEVTIEGEISRLDVKNGRLIFATVKDDQSAVDVFSLTNMIRNLRELEPGMLVHVTGTAGLYKGSGKFRVYAKSIVPHGAGALQLAFDKLKQQLEAEGLFDVSHKRPLPAWPKNIGIITAKDSSVYHDLVKITTARMSGLTLKHLPVNVQGREAVPTILKALHYVNFHKAAFDVVILARGGGSLEDLAAFNSEEVARAVFGCKVPIISAIGHEDNWSLTDFVADLRASTPSNAAELVVKDRSEVLTRVNGHLHRIRYLIRRTFTAYAARINQPVRTMQLKWQDVRQAVETLERRVARELQAKHHRVVQAQSALTLAQTRVVRQARSLLHLKTQELTHLERLLDSLNYERILARGFSITSTATGKILKDTQAVKAGEIILTQLATGKLKSQVK